MKKEIVAWFIIIFLIVFSIFVFSFNYNSNLTGNAFLNFFRPSSSQTTGAKSARINIISPQPRYQQNYIPINNCTIIAKPGNYQLTNDLVGAPVKGFFENRINSCIMITVSDVTLDCNEHSIKDDKFLNKDDTDTGVYLSLINLNNIRISKCNVSHYRWGIYTMQNKNLLLENNKLFDNSEDGLFLNSLNSSRIINNKIFNNNNTGLILVKSFGNNITNNTIYNNNNMGIAEGSSSKDNVFLSNEIYNNQVGVNLGYNIGISFYTSNKIHNNFYGIIVIEPSITLDSNQIYNNFYGFYEEYLLNNKLQVSLTKDHFYNNSLSRSFLDLNLRFNGNVVLNNVIFDNPKGDLQNYTTLSINQLLLDGYLSIKWAKQPAALPNNMKSFANKVIEIKTNETAGLKNIVWSWTPQEANGYNVNKLRIKRYNGSWNDEGGILKGNTLTLNNVKNSGIYAIVEDSSGIQKCDLIDPSLESSITSLQTSTQITYSSGTDFCVKNGYKSCSKIVALPRNLDPKYQNATCSLQVKCNHISPNQSGTGNQTTTCFVYMDNTWIGPPKINCCS